MLTFRDYLRTHPGPTAVLREEARAGRADLAVCAELRGHENGSGGGDHRSSDEFAMPLTWRSLNALRPA
jgi:hypothetical protein